MSSIPHCAYCEIEESHTTDRLRIASSDPWGGSIEYVCGDCFTATDEGPSFDDLPLAPMTPSKFLSTACPQTREAALSMIPIERLTTGTVIEVPGFGAAEVYQIVFDDHGYTVGYCTDDRRGWDALDCVYILAGSTVEFAGRGEPHLKPVTLSDVTSIVCADILSGSLGSYGKVA